MRQYAFVFCSQSVRVGEFLMFSAAVDFCSMEPAPCSNPRTQLRFAHRNQLLDTLFAFDRFAMRHTLTSGSRETNVRSSKLKFRS